MATPGEERTLEERVSRLEGAYEHLATKADVARLEGEMKAEMYRMESRIVRWIVSAAVISAAAGAAIVTALNSLINAS